MNNKIQQAMEDANNQPYDLFVKYISDARYALSNARLEDRIEECIYKNSVWPTFIELHHHPAPNPMDFPFIEPFEVTRRKFSRIMHDLLFDVDDWFQYLELRDYFDAMTEPEWEIFV